MGFTEDEDEEAALGGTPVEAVVVFAEADAEIVEEEVVAVGPSAALDPEDTAGFCREVRMKGWFQSVAFALVD